MAAILNHFSLYRASFINSRLSHKLLLNKVKACKKVASNAEYSPLLYSLADNSQWNQICPHQCTEITFKMSSKRTPHDISDLALVYMSYYSDRMLLLEEYLVFDFSSILVAIGGSLGLFLGFSFFQCGSEILYESMGYLGKLIEFCKKKCAKESNETEMA